MNEEIVILVFEIDFFPVQQPCLVEFIASIMCPTTRSNLPQVSNTAKATTLGNDIGRSCHGDHIFTNMSSSSGSTFNSHSPPEPKFSQYRGTFSSFGLPFERHYGFFPKSSETSLMNNVGYSWMSLGNNDGNYMLNAALLVINAVVSIPRNMPDNGSSNFRMRSSRILSPVFLVNGPYPGLLPTAMESLSDRVRSR
ncbi:unnamed protein product [Trifolium pratense]|uniref:Uncharacterized protein n=1 Tax=Trifolium pratense TaxID=57577 RepID=A0ACB0K9I5_TRIPR|nr:unnamed protein product [Trifolium pratense]